MENEQSEQLIVKPKQSKLAIAAVVTAVLPLFITPSMLYDDSLPASRSIDVMLFAIHVIRIIPVALGGWSCVRIIQSKGKIKGIRLSLLAICLGLFWVLMLFLFYPRWIIGPWFS